MNVNKKKASFITIYDWMISDLKLGSDELIVYACIYGFNKYTGQDFFGGPEYISRWTASDEDSIKKALGMLNVKGHIRRKSTKTERGYSIITYKASILEKEEKIKLEIIEDDEIDDLFPN